MSQDQLVSAYVRGDISRRTFVRRSVALGISLSAALSYADLIGRTDTARASHFDYYGCDPYYEENGGDPPVAVTLAAQDVTAKLATLRATVDTKGTNSRVHFDVRVIGKHGRLSGSIEVPAEDGPGSREVSWRSFILQPGTDYAFAVIARNGGGCHVGQTLYFSTLPLEDEDEGEDEGEEKDKVTDEDDDGAAQIIAAAPPAFGAVAAPKPGRILLDVDGTTTNLARVRRRRALGLELTCSDPAVVDVTATIVAPIRRLGRKPQARVVQIASGSVRFAEGDTKAATLTISRQGLRLLARRSRVTVTLVAVATRTDGTGVWRQARGKLILEQPRRRG